MSNKNFSPGDKYNLCEYARYNQHDPNGNKIS